MVTRCRVLHGIFKVNFQPVERVEFLETGGALMAVSCMRMLV
jgi:hypothetical protein